MAYDENFNWVEDEQDEPTEEKKRSYTAEEEDFLRRNPGDKGRMAAALASNNTSKTNRTDSGSSNSGSGVVNSWNGSSGGGDSWYRSMVERQQSQLEDANARNRERGDELFNMLMGRANQSLSIRRPGTPGYQAPAATPPPGDAPAAAPVAGGPGLTRQQIVGITDQMTTRGLKGDPRFDLYASEGKGAQDLINYMNQFGGVDEQGNQRNQFSLNDVPEQFRGIQGAAPAPAPTAQPAAAAAPAEDPNAHIWAQADAYAAQQERARRNYISDMAEKGGSLANIQGEKRMASERYGQQVGSFEAELIGNEIQARRSEIQQALNGMQGMLTGDQQAQLQRELSLLDQGVKEQQLALAQRGQDIGHDEFLNQLALSEAFGWKDRDYRDIYGV